MMESALFQSRLADFRLSNQSHDPLFRLRQQAWERLLERGLPDKKSETYQYVKLRKLFGLELIPAIKMQIDSEVFAGSQLVFVNGYYSPELSNLPSGIDIVPLSEAVFSFGTYLNNQWFRTLKEEQDPFALMNGAFFAEGALIYIPPKTVLKFPLEILFVSTEENMFTVPRIELFLGSLAEAEVVTRHIALRGKSLVNTFTNILLEEGARLSLTQVAIDLPELWLFDALRAHLKRDASLTTVMATSGSETVRYDYQVELAGENSQAHLNGLWMLKESKEAHIHVLMKHLAPYCTSLQLFKGALNGSSRSSFEGKILVQKEAQKTDSFQLNNNLLLSEGAQAYSKPNLEIFADDVKASHGATFGQLDADELFYLKTRGLAEGESQGLLTRAFLQEVIEKVELPSIRNNLIGRSEEFLG